MSNKSASGFARRADEVAVTAITAVVAATCGAGGTGADGLVLKECSGKVERKECGQEEEVQTDRC